MEKNPDGLDAFLKDLGERLGVDVNPSTKEQSVKQPDTHSVIVRVHSLSEDGKTEYYIHSYILGQVDVSDLKGQPVEGSIALQIDGGTLQDVCAKIEQNLSLFDIRSHRDPPEGVLGPGHANASYELMNRLNDPQGRATYLNTMHMLKKINDDSK